MTWKEAEDEAKLDRFFDEPERDRGEPTPEEVAESGVPYKHRARRAFRAPRPPSSTHEPESE